MLDNQLVVKKNRYFTNMKTLQQFDKSKTQQLEKMEIGEKIRYARLKKGYSQENMADFLGISTSAYGDIERNKTELTLSRAKKLSTILKMSMLELIEEEILTPKILDNSGNNELEQLKNEVNTLRSEANYWREKFEQQVLNETYRMLQGQYQREKIGF